MESGSILVVTACQIGRRNEEYIQWASLADLEKLDEHSIGPAQRRRDRPAFITPVSVRLRPGPQVPTLADRRGGAGP
jgi:hypothetical protein